tara:strand:- start:127 stop:300 length:174 start_codon:yes stop_codon:yes gene_type:complete
VQGPPSIQVRVVKILLVLMQQEGPGDEEETLPWLLSQGKPVIWEQWEEQQGNKVRMA